METAHPPSQTSLGMKLLRSRGYGVASRAVSCIFYDDLYLTEQPYGFVCGVVTGLPARDSSNAALT
jgi:hypothetical protein